MTRDDMIRIANDTELFLSIWIDEENNQEIDSIERFADQILEEVAQEIAKLPFGDTAASFAVFVRQMKVNRSDNGQERGRLSATSTPAE